MQASGNVFFLNYLSPCISVREERYKTCNLCQEWKLIFFEKPWLPAGNINQLETTSQAVLSPAQSASSEKLHHD